MSGADIIGLALVVVYSILFGFLGLSVWWRKKLLTWAVQEKSWLLKEGAEIELMRKFLMEQNEWETRRTYYGNPLMNAAFDGRVNAYNGRRERYLGVIRKAGQLLPW